MSVKRDYELKHDTESFMFKFCGILGFSMISSIIPITLILYIWIPEPWILKALVTQVVVACWSFLIAWLESSE